MDGLAPSTHNHTDFGQSTREPGDDQWYSTHRVVSEDSLYLRSKVVCMRGMIVVLIIFAICVTGLYFYADKQRLDEEGAGAVFMDMLFKSQEKNENLKHRIEQKAHKIKTLKQQKTKLKISVKHLKGDLESQQQFSKTLQEDNELLEFRARQKGSTIDNERQAARDAHTALVEAWAAWDISHPEEASMSTLERDDKLAALLDVPVQDQDETTAAVVNAKNAFDVAEERWMTSIDEDVTRYHFNVGDKQTAEERRKREQARGETVYANMKSNPQQSTPIVPEKLEGSANEDHNIPTVKTSNNDAKPATTMQLVDN